MNTTLILLGLLVLFIVVAAAGGVFWIIRRRQSDSTEDAAASKTEAKKTSSPQKQRKKLKKRDAKQSAGGNGQPSPPSGQNALSKEKLALPPKPEAREANKGYAPPGEKIRILIVDDNTGTRENVSRLLYFEEDMEVIGQAVNGRYGVEMAADLKPHIVLMDINMPDMDGITATDEMSRQAPYSQVVIMSVQSDQHYMRRAMAAGARDFQPKPFTSEELVNCIRRVYSIGKPIYQQMEAIEQAQKTEKSNQSIKAEGAAVKSPAVVVYSPKGGVGKSAIAANLAVGLQQEQGQIALVDGALQFGDLQVHLNTRPTRTVSDMVHHNELEIELLPEVMLAHNSGLKLLLGPPQPQLADAITPAMIGTIIKDLKRRFKAVVIDTPSRLNDLTLSILDEADYILIVTTPELMAIKDAKLFLELAEQLNFDLERTGVVINQAYLPGGINPDQIEEVLNLDHTFVVPADPRMQASLTRGAAICQQDPSAPSAQAIKTMAREIWQQLSSTEESVKETA